jgi:hypothetical protein
MAKNQTQVVNKEFWPTKEDVNSFEILFPMIKSDLDEIRELSKKKQDEPLNKFKVKILNKKLEKAKIVLKNESTSEYLELLDEETLPTNSDAVLQISQFVNALKEFQIKYYFSDGHKLGLEHGERNKWKTKD